MRTVNGFGFGFGSGSRSGCGENDCRACILDSVWFAIIMLGRNGMEWNGIDSGIILVYN